MKKLLVITPHLSTGGAPQVTANKVKLMKQDFEIMVVEHAFVAWTFVVQRNRIIETIGEANFKSLGDNKTQELQDIINSWQPDVISMEEFPEMFMDKDMSDWLYRPEREYTIIETTHDSSFNPSRKTYMPDKFVFVSPFNALKYNHLDIPYEVIEYPVDKKTQNKAQCRAKLGLEPDYKHIVIIGLFTPRKNQKYAFELCEQTADYKIKYHFLGNQAGNFESY
jgi:glycosyltransferase involved in cell wall biosynthesis